MSDFSSQFRHPKGLQTTYAWPAVAPHRVVLLSSENIFLPMAAQQRSAQL